MNASVTNERYESIVEASLIFFTILVGLKLADLVDQKNVTLGGDQWPCFIIGVAFFLRYVTGSYNHQRAQNVNRLEEHDRRFLLDIGFLIAFGVIAVYACEADTVPAFLNRLIGFTATAFASRGASVLLADIDVKGGEAAAARIVARSADDAGCPSSAAGASPERAWSTSATMTSCRSGSGSPPPCSSNFLARAAISRTGWAARACF